jgi:hypothetical protein
VGHAPRVLPTHGKDDVKDFDPKTTHGQMVDDLLEAAADQPRPTPKLKRAVQILMAKRRHPHRDLSLDYLVTYAAHGASAR